MHTRLSALALATLLSLGTALPSRAAEPAAKAAEKPAAKAESNGEKLLAKDREMAVKGALTVLPDEVIVGEPAAKVTIIEYASLSCPHCADFYGKVYPKLKAELIDTGKARFVFRHFPLNVTALKGGILAECAPIDRRHDYLKVLFDQQKNWAFTPNYEAPLATIASVGGMSREQFDTCMKDAKLENKLIESRKIASEILGVESTPTFFINGNKVVGEKGVDDFKALVAEASQKRAKDDAKAAKED